MMNKHTPGPWSIGPYGEVIGASGEKVVLAGGFSVGSTYERPERQSNLVLAVAAPELLEALEEVTSDLFLQIEAKHGAEFASKYPSIVAAKAARDKARGAA